jgi:hypothetical protein
METTGIDKALQGLIDYSSDTNPLKDIEEMFFTYLCSDSSNEKEERESVVLTYQFIKKLLTEIELSKIKAIRIDER